MSRSLQGLTRDVAGFPRVSGDEPPVVETFYDAARFSPRGRG